jgi:hypothetical protein
MNTTNNINKFLESIPVIHTKMINPSYDKIFNLLNENDCISYYIDQVGFEKYKTADLIKIENVCGMNVDNFNVPCSNCLIPVKIIETANINVKTEGPLIYKAYTLSIRHRAFLKKMVDHSFYNSDGLYFQNGKFVGLLTNVPHNTSGYLYLDDEFD